MKRQIEPLIWTERKIFVIGKFVSKVILFIITDLQRKPLFVFVIVILEIKIFIIVQRSKYKPVPKTLWMMFS